ncbi:MAG TPA: substrate-binding domain-containing protein [Candidatus Limnocylindrales bacterium]
MIYSRKAATLFSMAATVAIVVSACSSSAASSTPGATTSATSTPAASVAASAAGCKVGVSWNNYSEERWAKWDEPAIKAALTKAGATYLSNDAKSSSDTQASNVDALISQGANVVIILAQDGTAIKPAVAKALSNKIPVIAYDRLIEDAGAFYITFDNVLVGKMQAEAVLAAKPSGNFVIIKGNKADANADFLREGMVQAGIPKVGETDPAGKIKIVGETYTDNWDPANAQNEMAQFLTANSNKVDAVISENDGMAGGVVAALASQGMAGTVPVSGQDGDAAALNRIALGTQTVDVWKDARMLGQSAAEAAVALCNGTTMDKITTTNGASAIFKSPAGNSLNSILLKPQAITKDNLSVVLDAKWIDAATLCKDVKAGSVKGC